MTVPYIIFQPAFEVLLLAFIIDILIGEPPAVVHPVVWMGRTVGLLQGLLPGNGRVSGILLAAVMVTISLLAGILVANLASVLPGNVAMLLAAYFLKSTFSFRMLLTSARHIMAEMDSGNLDGTRKSLTALVSRQTGELDEPHIASSVIESVSENFVDTILSPLFFYLILGLPGALVFKAVNTLDSMVGYKNKELIDMGWASARLDDVLNWIPARLSLPFITVASVFVGSPVSCVRTCLKESDLTPSPNSGWPMAATAGALEVQLEKEGHYILGGSFRLPGVKDIRRVSGLVGIAALASILLPLVILYIVK